jgi:thiamine-phosphate pyrophosphorylase
MNNKAAIDYKLYLVTDRTILGARDLARSVEEAILGGVTIVQLREKDISSREFFHLAAAMKRLTDSHRVPLIINDRVDIALAVDAAGVHVGQSDLPAKIVRGLIGPGKVLGVSAATLTEALQAQNDGADYLGIGAVFPTNTKLDARSVALDNLGMIKQQVKIPVVAIGGIQAGNLGFVQETRVDGIAVVSAILGQADVGLAAKNLWDCFNKLSGGRSK